MQNWLEVEEDHDEEFDDPGPKDGFVPPQVYSFPTHLPEGSSVFRKMGVIYVCSNMWFHA